MRFRLTALLLALALLLTGCVLPSAGSGKKQYQASYLTLFDTVTYISGMAESEEAFQAQAREIHDQLLTYHQLFDIYNCYEGLNNLKTVNDTMGHSAGDQLILSFARLLRRVIPEKHFVGRYGGDEFLAVIYHTDRQEVEGILDSLRREADAANRDGNQLPLSYAYGWAISADYEGCVMQTLLDKADYCMYENKRAYYATHDRRVPRS